MPKKKNGKELLKELEKHSEYVKDLQNRMKPKKNPLEIFAAGVFVFSFLFMPIGLTLWILEKVLGLQLFLIALIWWIWSMFCIGIFSD